MMMICFFLLPLSQHDVPKCNEILETLSFREMRNDLFEMNVQRECVGELEGVENWMFKSEKGQRAKHVDYVSKGIC